MTCRGLVGERHAWIVWLSGLVGHRWVGWWLAASLVGFRAGESVDGVDGQCSVGA